MWIRLTMIAALMAALAGGLWKSYSVGYANGENKVTQAWEQERAQIAAAQAEEMMKARQRESALRSLADRLRKEKADEARRLADEYAADLERLQNRPDRPSDASVSGSAAAGDGCTGEGLYRGDAQFLVGLAADAARTQSALDECRVKYNALTQTPK